MAAAALWASASSAQERLTSDRDRSEYPSLLREVLKDAFQPEVTLRAIVEPSFAPEYAVGLQQKMNGVEVFAIEPSRQVWGYIFLGMLRRGQAEAETAYERQATSEYIAEIEARLPANPADLPVSYCSMPIDGGIALLVEEAWKAMLEPIASDGQPLFNPDGTTYRFSMEIGDRRLAGQARSPDAGTRPGKLAKLAEAMRDYCRSRSVKDERRIAKLAESLRAHSPGPVPDIPVALRGCWKLDDPEFPDQTEKLTITATTLRREGSGIRRTGRPEFLDGVTPRSATGRFTAREKGQPITLATAIELSDEPNQLVLREGDAGSYIYSRCR
jgi:hypothetical protein